MDVVSAAPFRTASILWQPRPGLFALTVVCKVTFVLGPGTCSLALDQDAPNDSDEHRDDDPRRSLRAASDLAPFKRRADVLVVGHAHAPGARPVSSLVARVIVGRVDKAVEVHADRMWTPGAQLREGAPFVKMPLSWERAAGGPETSNPVGVRADARPDAYGQVPLPNLGPPGFHVARQGEAIPPVGLGPLAPTWPARAAMLHRHAATWDHRRWNERPMPEDLDQAFFNAAPPDQQTDALVSDERIVLENLHADHPRLVTSLPGLLPVAVVERPAAHPLALRCDTLCIDTDRGVCTVVWRGQVPLARADERGRVVISAKGMIATLPLSSTLLAAPAEDDAGRETLPLPLMAAEVAKMTLPFRPGAPGAAAMPAVEAPARPPKPFGSGTTLSLDVPQGPVLPFAGAPRVESMPVQAPAFGPAAEPPTPQASREAVLPAELPAPPPMIGPLATAAMTESEASPAKEEVKAAAPVALVVAERKVLPLDAFPIERCAATAASMARRREDRAKILEESELTQETWDALVKHWTGEIREETKRGKTTLLEVYDRAYVARLEKERGPIQVEEYARIVVAGERGNAEETLAELTLPRGAMVRIQRVWVGRVAAVAAVAARVRAATEAARSR